METTTSLVVVTSTRWSANPQTCGAARFPPFPTLPRFRPWVDAGGATHQNHHWSSPLTPAPLLSPSLVGVSGSLNPKFLKSSFAIRLLEFQWLVLDGPKT